MELRQLHSFMAVAEELHFGRAALRLNLAQPAVSRHIQKLEEELQFKLFLRTKRRVQLTPAGTVYLSQLSTLFPQLSTAVEAASRVARGQTGALSLGFVGGATFDLLPAIVRTYRRQSPGVELILAEMPSAEQVQALKEKRIDAGILRPPVSGRELSQEIIAHQRLAIALHRDHHLAGRRILRLQMLAHESFILFPNSPKSH